VNAESSLGRRCGRGAPECAKSAQDGDRREEKSTLVVIHRSRKSPEEQRRGRKLKGELKIRKWAPPLA